MTDEFDMHDFMNANLEEIYNIGQQYTEERPVLCCTREYLQYLSPITQIDENFTGFIGLWKAIPIYIIKKPQEELEE